MKLELLVANEEALKTLASLKLSDAQLAWDLSDSLDVVEKAMTKFHEKRTAYVKEFGKPDPQNPEKYFIADPEVFTVEMKKLLDVEVEVTFPAVDIKLLNGVDVTPEQMRGWKTLGILVKND